MADLYAGVDLGGTTISCGLARSDGQIAVQRQIATESHEGPQAVLSRVAALVEDLIVEVGKRPVGLGMGHQTILPDGPLCGCGNHGCLEALASGPAMVGECVRLMKMGMAPQLYRRVDGDAGRVTPKELAAAVAAGDVAVRDAVARAANYLGIGVANVVTILHPDLVVLGGGVAEMGQVLLDRVRDTMRKRVGMFPTDSVRVERSLLGDKAGLLGAVALAADGVDGNN